MTAQALAAMPPAARAAYGLAFTASLNTVFLVAASVAVAGFAFCWLLPERPLRETVAASAGEKGSEAAGAFAQPRDSSAAEAQLVRAFRSIADRDVQRQHIQRIVERAGETLTPLAAWLLVQMERTPEFDPSTEEVTRNIPRERVAEALTELQRRDLLEARDPASPGGASYRLTPRGCDVLDRLVTARRAHLAELVAEWDPRAQRDPEDFLRSAVEEMVPDTRREGLAV
jgi:hypothetical protein